MEAFDKLKRIITEIEDALQKAAAGNKAAGPRVRQAMQDIKEAAQEVRVAILEMRDPSEKTDKKG